MSKPKKKLTLEERIASDIKSVEQQYKENQREMDKLQTLLDQRFQRGVELKGEFKALRKLQTDGERKEVKKEKKLSTKSKD